MTRLSFRAPLLAVPSTLLFATLSGAQTGTASFPLGQGSTGYYLPEPTGVTETARTVTGDILNDGLVDVFYRNGSELRCRFSPGLFDAPMTDVLDQGIVDFDIALDGDRDVVFASTATGLISGYWDNTAWAWSVSDEGTHPRWNGALFVRAVSRGFGRRPFVYGVMASGVDIRVLVPVTGGFSDRHVATLAQPVLEFEDLQFVSGGLPELAVVSQTGCAIYSGSYVGNPGTPVAEALTPGTPVPSSLSVGRSSSSNTGWVAWLHGTVTQPRQSLSVLAPGAAPFTLSLPATTPDSEPFAAGSLIAGDFDADGDADLMMTNTALRSFVVPLNLGTASGPPVFSWTSNDVRTVDLQNPTQSLGTDAMFAADIDNDGDADYGLSIAAESQFLFVKSGNVNHTAMTPGVVTYEPTTPTGFEYHEFEVWGPHRCRFRHEPAASIPTSATHLQLQLWKKVNPTTPLTPERLDVQFLPLTATELEFDLEPHIPGAPPTGQLFFHPMFFCTMRYVQLDPATQEITTVFPGRIFGFEGLTLPGQPLSANARWILNLWPGRGGDALELALGLGGDLAPTDPPNGQTSNGEGAGSGGGSGGECLPCDTNNPPKEGS